MVRWDGAFALLWCALIGCYIAMWIVSGVIALDYFCDAALWIVSRCYLFIGVKNYDEKRGASRMSSMDAAKACAAPGARHRRFDRMTRVSNVPRSGIIHAESQGS
ncbi:hypothetical protein F164LOC_18405 [Pectobacterium carotovorum]|nr:hypothetical protein F164LOC_18405 [Pectobacterium carotovorum]